MVKWNFFVYGVYWEGLGVKEIVSYSKLDFFWYDIILRVVFDKDLGFWVY